MARTNTTAVTNAIDTALTTAQVQGFIDDASAFVDEIAADDTTIAAARLTLIEKYLACHLVTLRDPRLKSARVGDVNEVYQRDDKMTEYLKAAIGLDPTNKIKGAFTDAPKMLFRVGAGYDDDLALPAT